MDNDKPYLDEHGDLVIPFACADNRYKYWKKEGMALSELLEELGAEPAIRSRYLPVKQESGQESGQESEQE